MNDANAKASRHSYLTVTSAISRSRVCLGLIVENSVMCCNILTFSSFGENKIKTKNVSEDQRDRKVGGKRSRQRGKLDQVRSKEVNDKKKRKRQRRGRERERWQKADDERHSSHERQWMWGRFQKQKKRRHRLTWRIRKRETERGDRRGGDTEAATGLLCSAWLRLIIQLIMIRFFPAGTAALQMESLCSHTAQWKQRGMAPCRWDVYTYIHTLTHTHT